MRVHECVRKGRTDHILGEMVACKPYITWKILHVIDDTVCYPFGHRKHADYGSALRHLAQSVELPKQESYLDIDSCVEGSFLTDYTGRIIVVSPYVLKSLHLRIEYQLHIAQGGKGCLPNEWTHPVYCVNLRYGYRSAWDRQDILGIVRHESLPAWAKKQ